MTNLVQPVTKVSLRYLAALASSNQFIMGHFYQFTSTSGAQDYFTDLDMDVNYNNALWKSGSLRITGLRRKLSVGIGVDEQAIKIWASPQDTLWGGNFLSNVLVGVLDGAILTRFRGIWNIVSGNAAYDVANNPPIAFFQLFTGYTSSIDKGGSSHVELKVRSPLVKLDINMPRNFYQPGCSWDLFSTGCTLSQSSFTVTGALGTGITSQVLPISGGIVGAGLDSIAQYAQGRLLFTSGVNNNLLILIGNNDTANIYPAYPLEILPSPGDTVTFYPGCSKSFDTCNLKYSNSPNFRGFDKVPPTMMAS